MSGRNQVDFTDDHAKIRDAITHMIPTPAGAYDPTTEHDCLQISYYQADLIQNKNDSQALAAATEDAVACAIVQRDSSGQRISAGGASTTAAGQYVGCDHGGGSVNAGQINTQYAVRRLTEVVRRVSALPGPTQHRAGFAGIPYFDV